MQYNDIHESLGEFEIRPDLSTDFHGNRSGYNGQNTVLSLFSRLLFHPILFILAGKGDIHESLEFEFRPD